MESPETNIIRGHKYTAVFLSIGKDRAAVIAEATEFETGIWYLNRVLTASPERREQGLGGLALRSLLDVLREDGATTVLVEPGGYTSDPERLVKFYERHGFARQWVTLGGNRFHAHAINFSRR